MAGALLAFTAAAAGMAAVTIVLTGSLSPSPTTVLRPFVAGPSGSMVVRRVSPSSEARPRPTPRPATSRPAPVHAIAATPRSAIPAPPTARSAIPAPPTAAASLCGMAISVVEARGLSPASGFVVICPGFALGHEGMTCVGEPGVCPGSKEIVIQDPQPYVVANEFENSRILSGSPARCHTIDCGRVAYGY